MPCFETCIIRKQKGAPKTHFWRALLASLTFCMRRFSLLCPAILRQITRKIRDDQQIFSIHGFRVRGEMDEINFPSCKIGKPGFHGLHILAQQPYAIHGYQYDTALFGIVVDPDSARHHLSRIPSQRLLIRYPAIQYLLVTTSCAGIISVLPQPTVIDQPHDQSLTVIFALPSWI